MFVYCHVSHGTAVTISWPHKFKPPRTESF